MVHIVLKTKKLAPPHQTRVSLRSIYDQIPEPVRARSGVKGWTNTKVLARDAVSDHVKLSNGDIALRATEVGRAARAITSNRKQFTWDIEVDGARVDVADQAVTAPTLETVKLVPASCEGFFLVRPVFDAVPEGMRRYANWSTTIMKVNSSLNTHEFHDKGRDAHVTRAPDVIGCIMRDSVEKPRIDTSAIRIDPQAPGLEQRTENDGIAHGDRDVGLGDIGPSTSASALENTERSTSDTTETSLRTVSLTYEEVLNNVRRVGDARSDLVGYGSVIDVIMLVTGKDNNQCNEVWRRLKSRIGNKATSFFDKPSFAFPEFQNLHSFQFGGRGEQRTPVAPLKILLILVQILPGRIAAQFRVNCADMLCRLFANDSSLSANDRRDLLRDVPGASSTAVTTESAAPSLSAIQYATRSQLAPNTALAPPWIPFDILKSPGGYLGSLGEETVGGRQGVRLKVGEAQNIEKRWSRRDGGHAATAPHAHLLWAATPANPRCTGHDIQERTKNLMLSDWCRRKGVLAIAGTSNEEFFCPLETVVEVCEYVSRAVERTLGNDAVGCHQKWGERGSAYVSEAVSPPPPAMDDRDERYVELAIARERTRQAEYATKQAELSAKQAERTVKMSTIQVLAEKGFTCDEIKSLTIDD